MNPNWDTFDSVDLAVYEAVDWAVVDDPAHPALRDFLTPTGAEAS